MSSFSRKRFARGEWISHFVNDEPVAMVAFFGLVIAGMVGCLYPHESRVFLLKVIFYVFPF